MEDSLRQFPELEVVISSSWRENHDLQGLRTFFALEVGERIVDVTPLSRDLPDLHDVVRYQRQAEIEAWLRRSGRPWEKWVALDDKSWLFMPFLPNLVLCDPRTGLDDAALRKLREKLEKRT